MHRLSASALHHDGGMNTLKTPVKMGRFGLKEDPIGRDVVFTLHGVERIARVIGIYQREGYSPVMMLRLRYFCGDDAPDIHIGAVKILRYPDEV